MNKERVLILLCEPYCPFGRMCGEKYKDGECKDKVMGVEAGIGSPEEVEAEGSTVSFTLTDPMFKPDHKVVIESGIAHISEVKG